MGRKLDLSGLSDNEAEHVLQVVQRDMRLRKKEEERLSELKQALDEEGSRCLLLSRQRFFNQRCCIRCCTPFSFVINPKRQCRDCLYNVCKACRLYSKPDKAWLCCACQKSRLLKKQSLDWFYKHVKGRFKRFGSAKVLKTIYRRHLAEHSPVSELTEASTYEESICNEGSVCDSDTTFYRQTKEHSMAETLTVAFRVAEEAIDEAISNAEIDATSQENQNEAHYLRQHRGELIQELAKTIMQKIISKRKILADMEHEDEQEGSLEPNVHRRGDQVGGSFKHLKGLWRSQSAFSLMDNNRDARQTSPKGGGSAVSPWTSVERLENAGMSSVLKSPDGNWIALQSAQLSRPSLLAKRKSLVYSALERESGAVSAYEGMDSDNEGKPELDSSWGAILQEFHRKLTASKVRRNADDRKDARSDSERKIPKSPMALVKRQLPLSEDRRPSSKRTSIIDISFNENAAADVSEAVSGKAKRSRKKRRSKRRATLSGPLLMDYNRKDIHSCSPSDADTPDTLTPDAMTPEVNQVEQGLTRDAPQSAETVSKPLVSDEDGEDDDGTQGNEMRSQDDDNDDDDNIDLGKGKAVDEKVEGEEEEEIKSRLYKLVAKSRLAYFSSTDDELDRAGRSEEDQWSNGQEETEGLTHQLSQLEKEVRATMFSSTEEELDCLTDEEENKEEEEEEEPLEVKLCRLANQAAVTQFSSTEDELDREEAAHEETLWNLQEDKAAQASQVRHLASLVSASQFSSTEDELDRVGEDEELWRENLREKPADEELSDAAVEDKDVQRDSIGKWESEEEDVEFDKIIISMLTLTLQDMQEHAKSEEKTDVKDAETEEERKDETVANVERTDAAKTEQKQNQHIKTDDEDEKTDNEKHVDSKIDEDSNENVKTDKNLVNEKKEDEKTDKNWGQNVNIDKDSNEAIGDPKEDTPTEQDINQDAKSENAKREQENWNKDEKTEKERTIDTMTNEESNEDAKRDKGRNMNGKMDKETSHVMKEETKTSENTEMDTQTEEKNEKEQNTTKDHDKNTMTHEERNDDIKKDETSHEDTKTTDERKEEEKTEKEQNKLGNTDDDGNINTDQETDDEKKEDPPTGENGNRDTKADETKDASKTDKDWSKADENLESNNTTHSEKEEDSMIDEIKNAKEEEERKVEAKTDKDWKKASEDPKERMQTNENRNEAGQSNKLAERLTEHTNSDGKDGNKDVKTIKETDDEMKEDVVAKKDESVKTNEKEVAKQVWEDPVSLLEDAEKQIVGELTETHKSDDLLFSCPPGRQQELVVAAKDEDDGRGNVAAMDDGLLLEEIRKRYSAASLCSITTEVLKVLNATEELLQGVEGREGCCSSAPALPANADPKKLDQQLFALEEKVYVAAGSVYGVEAELGELEERARGISSSTSDTELFFLEEQVASAATRVQQSELQISNISARIAALKSAGLDVNPQSRSAKARTVPVMPLTLSSSRQLRRRLPALPRTEDNKN
ncbi:calponin homology domain-containing protein DDB_G0272472 isoform X2 [Syngnathus scovelli]|uniref:calponin homology domain-containing protein DDB_G0272472 isoform X2 n=1 Tax=Syngnathus scovelli TaxID=161590 RepID=UPI0021103AB4|nr:rab effector MyRIP isoform X2 [Syngnathus scovelli]